MLAKPPRVMEVYSFHGLICLDIELEKTETPFLEESKQPSAPPNPPAVTQPPPRPAALAATHTKEPEAVKGHHEGKAPADSSRTNLLAASYLRPIGHVKPVATASTKRAPTPHPAHPRSGGMPSAARPKPQAAEARPQRSLNPGSKKTPPLPRCATLPPPSRQATHAPAHQAGRPLWTGNFSGANAPKHSADRLPSLPRFPAFRQVRVALPSCLLPAHFG